MRKFPNYLYVYAIALLCTTSALITASEQAQVLLKRVTQEKSKTNASILTQVKVKPTIIRTNIPLSFFRITELEIFVDGPLECLEKEFFIEADGDIYVDKLTAAGNITISTTGSVHLQDDVFAESSIRIKGKEVIVHSICKARGRMQLLANKSLRIIGSAKSKDILELIGKENVSIEGAAKGNEGVLAVAGGKLDQKGTVTSKKDVIFKAKEYAQTGTVVSQLKTVIFSEEDLTLAKVGQIAALQISLKSTLKNVLVEGDAYSKDGTLLSACVRITIAGTSTSEGPVAIEGKDYLLTSTGSLTSTGLSLQLETGVSFGSTLTRGHYSLKAKKYTVQKGSSTFTTGVHQVDCSEEYIDQGFLYVPVLLLAQGARLKFYEGHHSYIKDALLSSGIQIHTAEGTYFDLFGPRIFFQLASDGGVTFRGTAIHDSTAQFPLNLYLTSKHTSPAQASSITEAQLKAEIEKLAGNHPWRSLKKGTGFTITVQGSVKYAGTTKLDSGAFAIDAQGGLDAQRGTAKAGYFTGDSVSMRATNMALDKSTFQSYFDDVKVTSSEGLTMKQVQLSAGMNTLIKALSAAIEKSGITSVQGRTDLEVKKSVAVATSTLKSREETLIRGKEVGFTGVDITSGTTAVVLVEQALRIYDSAIKSVQNTLAGQDVDMRKVTLGGDTTVQAENDLAMQDLKSTGKVATKSGGTTTLHNVEGKEVVSHGKKIVKDGKLISEGAVELVGDTVEHNDTTEGQTVFIQATEFNDSTSSTVVGHQRVSLDVKKGNGLRGQLKGDTVSISMDDFQLAHLEQVIARVTQLHINKDVVIDKNTILKNSLHLWARKLINRAGLTVEGDFSAYMTSDILLNGTMNIKGTGAFSGTTVTSEKGKLSGANLYLQAREGDVSLYKAILKTVMDVKINAERGNIKKVASEIQSGRDTTLAAARSIEERSVIEKTAGHHRTDENIIRDKITAGGNITKKAGEHIVKTAIENSASGNYTEEAGGNIVDMPLAREKTLASADEENTRFTREVTQEVSEYKAGGAFTSKAGGNQELYAPKVDAQSALYSAGSKLIAHEVHDSTEQKDTHTHDGGFFGQQRTRRSYAFAALSKGLNIRATQGVKIEAGDEVSLTSASIKAARISLISATSAVRILLGKNQTHASSSEKSENILWQKQRAEVQNHTTYSESKLDGIVEIKAKQVFVEEVKGKARDLAQQLEAQGITAIYKALDEIHDVDIKSSQGPSAALAAVVVIAVSICTAGTGAALGAAVVGGATSTAAVVISTMTAAAFTSLCCQATLALLANEGNIIKAAESLFSIRTLENLGVAMLTAGVTAGIGSALNIPSASEASTAIDHIERQAVQSSVSTTAAIAQGKKPEDAVIQGLKGAAAGAIGAIATTEIGNAYLHNHIDFIGHKFLHALVGGATGAAMGDKPLEGAAAGAFGAVTAEMMGELVLSNCNKIAGNVVDRLGASNKSITPEQIQGAIREELATRTNFIKLLTSGLALLTSQDVSIATFTASNALDNNLSNMARHITEHNVYEILRLEGIPVEDLRYQAAEAERKSNLAAEVREKKYSRISEEEWKLMSLQEKVKAINVDGRECAFDMPGFDGHVPQSRIIANEEWDLMSTAQRTEAMIAGKIPAHDLPLEKTLLTALGEAGVDTLLTGGVSALANAELTFPNASLLSRKLYDRIRTLPSVSQEEFREFTALQLEARFNINSTIIYEGEAAASYKPFLEKNLADFNNARGILGKDSPITKITAEVERNITRTIEQQAGAQGSIDGAMFELDAAQSLKANNYKVEAFAEKLGSAKYPKKQEFDLTYTKDGQTILGQCKLTLPTDPKNMKLYREQFGIQKATAADLGYKYEVISTSVPSKEWEAFFNKKDILFRKIDIH